MLRIGRRSSAERGGSRRTAVVVAVGFTFAASALSVSGLRASASASPTINVLSTRADLISGGVALASVTLPAGVSAASAHETLNGNDITSAFAVRANGLYEGLVSGLALGNNLLVSTVPGGGAQIILTNHPIGGPVFSGPQIQPWICETGATDAQCNLPTSYAYMYKSSVTGQFSSYNPSSPPSDLATTTTDNGHTVPYIIRVETGYQDRDEYQAAVLWTFTSATPDAWAPWASQPQWDGKLEIPGGMDCGFNHGTAAPPSVTDNTALSRGMMVAAPTLDNNEFNCNIVLQAEAVEMMKEHIVDDYGPIKYTIGSGCSGGSIFQQQVANAYPGLLNGILPECSFPDSWSTGVDVIDCDLLLSYLDSSTAAADALTPTEQAAIVDDSSTSVCQSWVNVYSFSSSGNPSQTNSTFTPCDVSSGTGPNDEYEASTNPGGVRCDLQDWMPNVLGIRPSSIWDAQEQQVKHGFVNSPYDNVGVQYGLNALLAGTINAQQFTDLNVGVGGFTLDLVAQPTRTSGTGLANVYRSGAVDEANNLSDVPIIDLRGNDDTEIHSNFRSYAMRQRLTTAQGSEGHGNQAIWIGPVALFGYEANSSGESMAQVGFLAMDQWLTNIHNDTSSKTAAQKVVADKPAAATDTCFDASGTAIPDQSLCPTLYPHYGSPRIGSGGPASDDILKCQLKPFDPTAYPGVTFTAAEISALQGPTAFGLPGQPGVCDFGKTGVGQASTVPWQTYQDSSGKVIYGGTPLGSASVSQPIGPATAGAGQGSTTPNTAGPPPPVWPLPVLAGLLALLAWRRLRSRPGVRKLRA